MTKANMKRHVSDVDIEEMLGQLQGDITENLKCRLEMKGKTISDYAREVDLSVSTMSLKINGKRDWTLKDILSAAIYFNTTAEGIMSRHALEELKREVEERREREKELERRYLQARKELDEQFKRERASVSGLGKRRESTNPRYNDDGSRDEVGNKGLALTLLMALFLLRSDSEPIR